MNSNVYINSILSKYQGIPASVIQQIDAEIAPYKNIPYSDVPQSVKSEITNELSPYVDKVSSTLDSITAIQAQIQDMLTKATNLESSLSAQLTNLLQYIQVILTAVADILTDHLTLISADTKELANKIMKLLISVSVAAFAGIFALLLISLFAVVIFWDTHRILAFSIVIGVFVTVTLAAVIIAANTAKSMPLLFGQLIAQLKKDKTFIQNL